MLLPLCLRPFRQPDYVTWAVDGKNLRTMRNGEFRKWYDMGGVEQR
jgi:hypothetical protein